MTDGMTQAWYGSYQHDANRVGIRQWNRVFQLGQTGYPSRLITTATIWARIIRSTQLEIIVALQQMRDAYSIGGQTFTIFDDVGNVLWTLDNQTASGGVMVLEPVSHGQITDAHGVTYLDWEIKLQHGQLLPRGQNQYLSFQESLEFRGRGQPLQVLLTPATGKMFKQQTTEGSWRYCTQQGSLTTTTPNPKPMKPIFPQHFLGTEDDQSVTYSSPVTLRGAPMEWTVSWAYQYASSDELIGKPNAF